MSQECRKSPLCDENGYFLGTFHVPFSSRIFLKPSLRRAISAETEAQVKKYLKMGFSLKHADSHNYTHSYISVWQEVEKILKKYDFKSTRISRNIPQGSFSPVFSVYKWFFNTKIKRSRFKSTEYFGSFQDYEASDNKEEIKRNLEIMTHPVYIDGVLMDNTLPEPHEFKTREWLDNEGLETEDLTGGKIKLLVAFVSTHIGGAMTSLVNFLNAIDTEKYDVDLLFYENKKGRCGIKEEINILPQAKHHKALGVSNILKKGLSPMYVWARLRREYWHRIRHNSGRAVQIMSKQGAKFTPLQEKEYDIAIAYEYTWPLNYVATKVKAKKKMCWSHMDYKAAGLDYRIDRKSFLKMDAIVFVSQTCCDSFKAEHEEVGDKCFFMPNLLSGEYIKQRRDEYDAEIMFDDTGDLIKLVSVSRIIFEYKGLDRALRVFKRLLDENLLTNVRWSVIGKGDDMEKFCEMIKEYNLSDYVFPMGVRENPIPYLKKHDALFLPSLNEGKPVVVTEALMAGIGVVVTKYNTAPEQIRHKVDGIILENSEEGLYQGLKKIIENPSILKTVAENAKNTDYGNEKEIVRFYELTEKILRED